MGLTQKNSPPAGSAGHAPATRLCLIRHGETAWNAERRLQGHLDVPLNATGRAQAVATAERLANVSFHACYSSDLERAQETARTLLRGHPLPLQLTPALRERHYGCFQGLTYEEAEQRYPEVYLRFKQRQPDYALPDGGESLLVFKRRIGGFIDTVLHRHAGQRILLVAHGGVLEMIRRIATGQALEAPRDFPIPNATLNWLRHHDGAWQLETWADQQHLDRSRDELANT